MSSPHFGLGFRTPYAEEIARAPRSVDWLEIVSDHYLGVGGSRRALLERLRSDHPIALHGVGLGIAGSDPLDAAYLDALHALVSRCEPIYVSDHLCWTSLGGHQSHDLLPVAYTGDVLRHTAERVARVQDRIGRRLLVENATAYVAFRAREMDEAEFLAELCRSTGCGVLLDVNNLFVNALNLGADPERALALLPESAVGYMHLAGHTVLADVRIDTHADAVPPAVWQLFTAAVQHFPAADVIVERDDALPAYAELVAEVDEARACHAAALAVRNSPAPRRDGEARAPHRSSQDWGSLQREFWQRVVDPPGDAGRVGIGALLDEDLPVGAARGLRVYVDAYAASLRAALATNFPTLVRVLGADDWVLLSRAYLSAHPPRGHGFVRLGEALADFVRGHDFAADHGVSRTVLAELVLLEQAQLEAQDAADPETAVAPAELAAIDAADWERARLVFAPCVRVVRTTHDVAPVVRAVGRGELPDRPPAAEQAYLVTRRGGGVCTDPLAPDDAAMLEALLAGRAFGEACADLRAESGAGEAEVAERGARLLVQASAQGWLSRVELSAV